MSEQSEQLKRAKGSLRREVRALRDALAPEQRERAAALIHDRALAEIARVGPPATVMAFWSFRCAGAVRRAFGMKSGPSRSVW